MFEVVADEILYDRRTVARFLPNVQPTLRDSAEADLYFDALQMERENDEIIKTLEGEHKEALANLEAEHEEQRAYVIFERDEAFKQRDEYAEILRLIENEESMAEQLLRARAEVEEWKAKYLEAVRQKQSPAVPKKRKPR